MKFGIDWATQREGWGVNFELFSPRLLTWGTNEQRANLSAFIGLGANIFPNRLVVGSAYEDTSASEINLGLRLENRGLSQLFNPYVNLGASYAMTDDRAFSKTSNWGGMISIGAEFPYGRVVRDLFGETLGSLYLQSDYDFGHGRADRIERAPDLFNGVTLRLGFRASY